MREVLSVLILALSIGAIFQNRTMRGILMRMGMSIVAVALYAVLSAPDVALAEAMVGALLTTFVYVLLLRTPGTIRVGYVPTPILFEENAFGYDGIEYEIVRKFASSHGYRLEFIRFDDPNELLRGFEEGYVDIACGPLVSETGILETAVFTTVEGEKIDLLSAMKEGRSDFVDRKKAFYTVLGDVEGFEDFLKDLEVSGELEGIIRKYAGDRI